MAAASYYANTGYAAPPAPDYLGAKPQQQQQQQPGPYGYNPQHQYQQQYASPPPPQQYFAPPNNQAFGNAPPSPYYGASTPQAPPPPYQMAPSLQPPAASVYGSHIQQSQPSIPPSNNYAPAAATQMMQNLPPKKLSYIINQSGEHKGSIRTKFRDSVTYTMHPLEDPKSKHALYTFTCTGSSKLHKDVDLVVTRGNNGPEVGRVTWITNNGFQNISPCFPFMAWPEAWNPELQVWGSDAGTLQNKATMQWVYGPLASDTEIVEENVQRCLTTGLDMDGEKFGRKGVEVCRAIFIDDEEDDSWDDCARIELNGEIFAGCKREQMDEMVTIAVANGIRWISGWRVATAESGGGSHGATTTEALNLASESMNLAATIIGGGGS